MRKILLSVFLLASFSLIANAWLEVGNPRDPRDPRDPRNSPIICNLQFREPEKKDGYWVFYTLCSIYNKSGISPQQVNGTVVCPVSRFPTRPSFVACIKENPDGSVGRTWRCNYGSCSSDAPANR